VCHTQTRGLICRADGSSQRHLTHILEAGLAMLVWCGSVGFAMLRPLGWSLALDWARTGSVLAWRHLLL